MNDGKSFEAATEIVFQALSRNDRYASVERDVMIEDVRGEMRQADVLVSTKAFGFETKTLIECKDYKRRVGVGCVDALESKRRDLPIDFAVLVSRNGFTSGAITKAKAVGIRLCTLAENIDVSSIGLNVHLIIIEIFPKHTLFSFRNKSGKKQNYTPSRTLFNGLPLIEFVRKGIESGFLVIPKLSEPIEWNPRSGELMISMDEGVDLPVSKIIIDYEFELYRGMLSDLNGTTLFHNLIEGRKNAFIDQDELRDYATKFDKVLLSDPVSLSDTERLIIYKLVPKIQLVNFHGATLHADGQVLEHGAHCGPECKAFWERFVDQQPLKNKTDEPL